MVLLGECMWNIKQLRKCDRHAYYYKASVLNMLFINGMRCIFCQTWYVVGSKTKQKDLEL